MSEIGKELIERLKDAPARIKEVQGCTHEWVETIVAGWIRRKHCPKCRTSVLSRAEKKKGENHAG